jgi:hypothetical protein
LKIRRVLLLMVAVSLCLVTGCNFAEDKDVDHLAITHEAISNQDYKSASRHAKLVLRNEPGNREADIILS